MPGRGLDMGPRVKTDMRIPRRSWDLIDEVARFLGVPRNAFITVAALKFLIELTPLLPTRRRESVINRLEDEFAKMITAIRKTL